MENSKYINNLIKWNKIKNINPATNRKIQEGATVYKKYNKDYSKIFPNGFNYLDSVDDRDPISRVLIWEIENGNKSFCYEKDYNNLVLYKVDNIIHCIEKSSLSYLKKYKIRHHPVSCKPIPEDIYNMCKGLETDNCIDIKNECMKVFQQLTNISIFIDYNEFLNINSDNLNKLYYETKEFYTHNIPEDKKIKDVFTEENEVFNCKSYEDKQKILLKNYLSILTESSKEVEYFICYIIVGGLSLVSPKIKTLYPDYSFSF
uniref:Uncharacterized protein n=1 Tax=Megaviridae environmental sample TaxID=1737588 RepID=A0A5J6VL13_9VIRU|nr:MAG: hypothetical protein [Megaviridae environmental sample]